MFPLFTFYSLWFKVHLSNRNFSRSCLLLLYYSVRQGPGSAWGKFQRKKKWVKQRSESSSESSFPVKNTLWELNKYIPSRNELNFLFCSSCVKKDPQLETPFSPSSPERRRVVKNRALVSLTC